MLRIHFTADDLARVTVAPTYGPLAESLFGLKALRNRQPGVLPHRWRSSVVRNRPSWAAPLMELMGPEFGLDLFTVIGKGMSAEDGLDALTTVGPRRIHGEVEAAAIWRSKRFPAGRRWPSPWVLRFVEDRAAPMRLAALLKGWQRLAVAPYWDQARRYLLAEAAARSGVLARAGVEGLLTTLHPALRWRSPVLEMPYPGEAADLHLHGRGMEFVPAVFCTEVDGPYWTSADGPAVLFYPAAVSVTDAVTIFRPAPGAGENRALVNLVGRTRAAVLSVVDGHRPSTTELARRLGISAAGASQHATVLRRAGLITTVRDGPRVLHAVTPLGQALLTGPVSSEPSRVALDQHL